MRKNQLQAAAGYFEPRAINEKAGHFCVRPFCIQKVTTPQYFTEQPYGWVVGLATGWPAFTAASAAVA